MPISKYFKQLYRIHLYDIEEIKNLHEQCLISYEKGRVIDKEAEIGECYQHTVDGLASQEPAWRSTKARDLRQD